MYKHFLVIGIILFSMLFPRLVIASEVEWQLTWHYDNALSESVVFDGPALTDTALWQTERMGDKIVMDRNIPDWEAYNNLGDKLPIIAKSRNFLIFSLTTVDIDRHYSSLNKGTFYQLSGLKDGNIIINCPGFIVKSSTSNVNKLAATWDLKNFKHNENILKILVINGLWLGSFMFLFGFLIVLWIYSKNLKKAQQIIERKYSLDAVDKQMRENDKNKLPDR